MRRTLAQERLISYNKGKEAGAYEATKIADASLQELRKRYIIELTGAAANLAKANASLTYSLSKIMEQIK